MNIPRTVVPQVLVALLASLAMAAPAVAAAPGPLLPDSPRVAVDSASGSGAFGRWRVDRFGLPVYRYTLDQTRAPFARQSEILGSTQAFHQLGNGRAIATASNDGFVQLWSQDRRYQWVNRYQPDAHHYAGGFGWLRTGGRVTSTLYPDRPRGARTLREFGVGYLNRSTQGGRMRVDERVYPPLGGGPMLVHEVTIRNLGPRTRRGSWFEYWDANPYDQSYKRGVGMGAPRYRGADRTLTVAQTAEAPDSRPLTIFAAVLRGPVRGFAADTASFFGSGTRARPAAVAAGRLDGGVAPATPAGATGRAMAAFRAPWRLRRGQAIKLRYAYGIAHPRQIPGLVARERARPRSFVQSGRSWARSMPQARLGRGRTWLSRELQWADYTLRSGASYEECRGRRIISQGGYYQYDFGFQGAFRDPLQHMLPMIYADPSLARDVLLYSAQEQPRGGGQIPYAMFSLCRPDDALADANDMDLWLLWSAAEYVLATRDLPVLNSRVRFSDGGSATLWRHLERAFDHQESLLGPHGGYLTPGAGDWSDFSTAFLQMTESNLVSAQLAYVYPRVAELADLRGDRGFARMLRAAGARNRAVTRREWTGGGWYSRGYSGERQIGRGVIFGEPQPWAILAGVPRGGRARTLVHNIRRYLTGVGAPAAARGPAHIGSSQSPAASDPGVTEHSSPVSTSTGDNNAVFVGGSWYAVNGWLAWSLGRLGDTVPRARRYAFDELQRNTLRAHARSYPRHWAGTISVDDVCHAHFSTDPSRCGIGISTGYTGQVMHQPAWLLFDTIRLAGIEPTTRGYRIRPQLPLHRFSLRLPRAGVAYGPAGARGYVVVRRSARLRMEVRALADGPFIAYADDVRVRSRQRGDTIIFPLRAQAGRAAQWAITRER